MVAKLESTTIRAAAAHLAKAANRTVRSLAKGSVEHEPAFTDRMLGRIDQAMDGYVAKGIRWEAKTLTATAQEPEFGADFAGVLNLDLNDFKVSKGFLAQAKRIEPAGYMSPSTLKDMVSQCETMLRYTPEAFLFLYSIRGISVVPAASVVNETFSNPHELDARSLSQFYEEHFECGIGDRAISSPDPNMLDTLRARYHARKLSYLGVRSVEQRIQ